MVRQLALNCVLQRREGDTVHLAMDPSHLHLRARNVEERLQQALSDHLGTAIRLVIHSAAQEIETPARAQQRHEAERREQAIQAIAEDATVRALQETFDARVPPDSIRPID